jgi:putative endonuclease
VPAAKRFVYILKSHGVPARYYTGVTADVDARLAAHNAGRCPHTADGRPWRIDVVIAFKDEQRAFAFERYLKSGSGFAFARRHLRTTVSTPTEHRNGASDEVP